MLMNRILPLILLLVITCSAAAEDVFWVLGSFVDEDVARVEGNRISNDAGIEVLIFESIVNTRVQYRLLTGILVAPSDQVALRQQLMKVGVSDPWMIRFDDGPPYMETIFSDLGTDDVLSAAELAEIDTMLRDFEDEYAEDSGMLTEDIGSGLVSNASVGPAINYVVVGSYGTAGNANDYASKLGNAFPEILSHEVTVRRNEVSGETVYRVMIGPVLPSEEKSLIRSLSEWGVHGAWLLPGIAAQADIGPQEVSQTLVKILVRRLASRSVDSEFRASPAARQALRLLKVLVRKVISTRFALEKRLRTSRTPGINTKGFLVLVASR